MQGEEAPGSGPLPHHARMRAHTHTTHSHAKAACRWHESTPSWAGWHWGWAGESPRKEQEGGCLFSWGTQKVLASPSPPTQLGKRQFALRKARCFSWWGSAGRHRAVCWWSGKGLSGRGRGGLLGHKPCCKEWGPSRCVWGTRRMHKYADTHTRCHCLDINPPSPPVRGRPNLEHNPGLLQQVLGGDGTGDHTPGGGTGSVHSLWLRGLLKPLHAPTHPSRKISTNFPKRLELSFRTVLAFPKDSNRGVASRI